MLLIQVYYALVAWALGLLLLVYIVRSNVSVDWGSALTGLRFHIAIKMLLSIDMSEHLSHNWKPQLLLLYTLREVEQHEQTEQNQTGGGLAPIVMGASQGGSPEPNAKQKQLDSLVALEEGVQADDDDASARADLAGHTHEHMFAVANQLRHGSGLIIAAAIMQMQEGQANHDLDPVCHLPKSPHPYPIPATPSMAFYGLPWPSLTNVSTLGRWACPAGRSLPPRRRSV